MKSTIALRSLTDAATQPGDALRATPGFARFRPADRAVNDDAGLQPKLAENRKLATRDQGYRRHGREFAGADAIRFGTSLSELDADSRVTVRVEAGTDLVGLLRDVNRSISDHPGLDFAANAAPPSPLHNASQLRDNHHAHSA
jgi:cell fate (sporulation/competence/biofilm development) regulator YlbF (YheA/YmcA/DUF963 family)